LRGKNFNPTYVVGTKYQHLGQPWGLRGKDTLNEKLISPNASHRIQGLSACFAHSPCILPQEYIIFQLHTPMVISDISGHSQVFFKTTFQVAQMLPAKGL
jgi:hypothetical protein